MRQPRGSALPIAALIASSLAAPALAAGLAAGDAEADTVTPEREDAAEPAVAEVRIGGALRYNYSVRSWPGAEANRGKGGDLALDTFRVEADGSYGDLVLSAEYRIYSGYHMLHHGHVGWRYAPGSELQVGVCKVPFGILPYASHSWFFDLGYYVGLEDDYDAGVQHLTRTGRWDLRLAFFKNDEGHFTGDSEDAARYSYDIVRGELATPDGTPVRREHEEIDQVNARVARTFAHGPGSRTELGVSAQVGRLYDRALGETGDHQAYAAHVVGAYGPLGVMASVMWYGSDPVLPPDDAAGGEVVLLGAYDAPYWVASEGVVSLLNVAWTPGWSLGPLESLTFYNDYSRLDKADDRFAATQQNVLGASAAAGPLFLYCDLAFGKNHPWLGGSWEHGLAHGEPDAGWELRYNLNLGWYF